MSEQIPEHRPSAVVAAWESQKAHARPHLVKPTGSMHRSNEAPTPGKDGPQVDNGVSLCKHAWRQIVKVAHVIHRTGEKLARWRLVFTNYPWDRND